MTAADHIVRSAKKCLRQDDARAEGRARCIPASGKGRRSSANQGRRPAFVHFRGSGRVMSAPNHGGKRFDNARTDSSGSGGRFDFESMIRLSASRIMLGQ